MSQNWIISIFVEPIRSVPLKRKVGFFVFQLDISNLCCQNERIWVDGNVFYEEPG